MRTSTMRHDVSTFPAATAAGGRALTSEPAGARRLARRVGRAPAGAVPVRRGRGAELLGGGGGGRMRAPPPGSRARARGPRARRGPAAAGVVPTRARPPDLIRRPPRLPPILYF